ncbi:MAG: ABC transporter ATP-binding protein [Nitrososphaerota archaeon]
MQDKAGMVLLELVNIYKYYGKITALEDINLEVGKGELLTILGPSGSGKSTLLKIIGGFEEPSRGKIYINGKLMNGVPPYARPTSMVFQDLALFPHLNVFNNIAYGLKIKKVPSNEIKKKVREVAELLHIEELLDRRITQLSGGQQQRVALARSLILEPEILLLDEPLGPLDVKLRKEMQLELRRIQKRLNSTWIYVTHDHEEAMVMSDRVAILNSGRIIDVGVVKEIYEKPKNRFIAEFLGEVNIIECIVDHVEGSAFTASSGDLRIEGLTAGKLEKGDRVNILVRPEKIGITVTPLNDRKNSVSGKVVEIIYKGAYSDVKIETEDSRVFIARTFEPAYRVGERVFLKWDREDAVVIKE